MPSELEVYRTLTGGPVQIVTPDPTVDAALAVNDNWKALSDSIATLASELTAALQKANNLSDLVNAATARTNLGLGTMATQASTAYLPLSGGTITGNLAVHGTTSLDDGLITTDSNGNISAYGLNVGVSGTVTADTLYISGYANFGGGLSFIDYNGNPFFPSLYVGGSGTSLDNGTIYTDGSGNIELGGNVSIGYSNGNGNLTVGGSAEFESNVYVSQGATTSLDNGAITTNGTGNLYLTSGLQVIASDDYTNWSNAGYQGLTLLGTDIHNGVNTPTMVLGDPNGSGYGIVLQAKSDVYNKPTISVGQTDLGGAFDFWNYRSIRATDDGDGLGFFTGYGECFHIYGNGQISAFGSTSLDNGAITTSGYGNITATTYLSNEGYGLGGDGYLGGGVSVGDVLENGNSTILSIDDTDGIFFFRANGGTGPVVNIGNTVQNEYSLCVLGRTSFDNGGIITDGAGGLVAFEEVATSTFLLLGSGSPRTIVDSTGNIYAVGGSLTFTTRASAPSSPVKGQMYCDNSGNFHGYNGTAWKQFTVS